VTPEQRIDQQERIDKSSDLAELKTRYLSPLGYREAVHVAWMLCENVETYLMDHPCVFLDDEAFILADQAQQALFDLYQRLALLEDPV
jgi:hypothetical protein